MASSDGPILLIVSWLLVFSSLIAVLARLWTRWSLTRRIFWDDCVIIIALIFSIGQTGAVSIEVVNGLGQHVYEVPTSQYPAFQKSAQAANVCFLLSQFFARLSVFRIIRGLSPTWIHVRLSQILVVIGALWAISSTAVEIFKCQAPEFWQFMGNHCVDRTIYLGVTFGVSAGIDTALVLLPGWAILRMHGRAREKAVLVAAFSCRISAICGIIVQIYLVYLAEWNSDTTWAYWPVKIATEIVQCLGIVAACVPFLKPLLELLDSTISGAAELRRQQIGGTFNASSDGFAHNKEELSFPCRATCKLINKITSIPSPAVASSDHGGEGSSEGKLLRSGGQGDGSGGGREGKTRPPSYIYRNTSVVESKSRKAAATDAPGGTGDVDPHEPPDASGAIKQTTSFTVELERGEGRAGALLPLGVLRC